MMFRNRVDTFSLHFLLIDFLTFTDIKDSERQEFPRVAYVIFIFSCSLLLVEREREMHICRYNYSYYYSTKGK